MNQTDLLELAAKAGEEDAARAEDVADERAMVGSLVSDALAYRSSDDYQDLLRFVVRMRRFSPFNAALLHRQKPGLSYATFASEWRTKWKRTLEEGARPLVILLPFGPVGFVYDILDTVALPDAPDFPPGVYAFPATGEVKESALQLVLENVQEGGVAVAEVDEGDWHAGRIRRMGEAYKLRVNRNHAAAVRFVTIAHELGHLYLGHLGADKKRRIQDRRRKVSEAGMEVEAESVAYIVCHRHGVKPMSNQYLAKHVEPGARVDLDRVMNAADRAERTMGLAQRQAFVRG